MPHWTRSAPEDPRGPALPIRRAPPYGQLTAVVTSELLMGCDTHYYGGRTMPCERPQCDPCLKGVPFRWHAYVTAFTTNTSEHIIFEMTAQASDAFRLYEQAQGTIRGCLFKAHRLGQTRNGRVIIETKPADLSKIRLPNPPDLPKALAILWNVPAGNVTTDGQLKGAAHIQADLKNNGTSFPPKLHGEQSA